MAENSSDWVEVDEEIDREKIQKIKNISDTDYKSPMKNDGNRVKYITSFPCRFTVTNIRSVSPEQAYVGGISMTGPDHTLLAEKGPNNVKERSKNSSDAV